MVSSWVRAVVIAAIGILVVACGDEDSSETASATQVNHPPVISGEPVLKVVEGDLYDFRAKASDPDGDPLIFSVSGKPAWMTFDSETGQLTGRPNGKDVGKHKGIVVSVSDGQDEATLDPMDVEVVAASTVTNEAPVISGTPPSEAIVDSFYDFVPTVSDAEGDPLSFQIVNRPAWATFDAAIGRLSGTPAVADIGIDSDIVIRVTDGTSVAELGPFVISVNAAPVANSAPVISGTPDPDVLVGEAWTFTPQAGDNDADTLSFEVFNAPAWTSFDTVTGTLSGVPGDEDTGIHRNITITVSDGQASASLPRFSIEVISNNTPPGISGSPASSVEAGQPYSFTPTASDSDGDTLTFSIVNRPVWADFDTATGTLSGTPGGGDSGTTSGIVISVSDGEATASLASFAIEVIGVNAAPTISGTPGTSVLVGSTYSFTPQADDPDQDGLSFSVQNLPVWAGFDADTGTLSGSPGAADVGVYTSVSITVSDGDLTDTLGPFSIEVIAVATGSATLSWQPPTENTDGSPLQNLAGYVVYWGTASGSYSHSETIDNAGASAYTVGNLLAGQTYYFSLTAYSDDGLESNFSNEASKTIRQ